MKVDRVRSLYDGLRWMQQHPQERTYFGKTARQQVEQKFTADIMANRYINLYQELINP